MPCAATVTPVGSRSVVSRGQFDHAGLLSKMGSSLVRAMTRPDQRGEDDQAAAEAEAAVARGTARCLIIMKRANLFEHRHYAFGKTLVFLRNGVEGALIRT